MVFSQWGNICRTVLVTSFLSSIVSRATICQWWREATLRLYRTISDSCALTKSLAKHRLSAYWPPIHQSRHAARAKSFGMVSIGSSNMTSPRKCDVIRCYYFSGDSDMMPPEPWVLGLHIWLWGRLFGHWCEWPKTARMNGRCRCSLCPRRSVYGQQMT